MSDDPRVAKLQEQLLRERARAHDAMNTLQIRIAELEGQVRDSRIAADTATREMTEMRREMLQLRNQPAERSAQSERERELEQELESRRVAGINERMAAERLTETVRLLEHELLLLGTDTATTTALQRVGVIDRETAQALTGTPVAGDGPFATFAHVHDGQAIRLLVDLAPEVDESSPSRGSVPVDKFGSLTALEERLEVQEQRSLRTSASFRPTSAQPRSASGTTRTRSSRRPVPRACRRPTPGRRTPTGSTGSDRWAPTSNSSSAEPPRSRGSRPSSTRAAADSSTPTTA